MAALASTAACLEAKVADRLIGFLLGNGVLFEKTLPADGGGVRQIHVGLDALQIGAGLRELLIDFGRVDLGQQIALLHTGADIEIPALQVSVRARVNRRFNIRLDICRQEPIRRTAPPACG